jgi:hypothetical protein
VETHDGIEKIEPQAFDGCWSLRRIRLPIINRKVDLKKVGFPSVREVGNEAFSDCTDLWKVEFGDKLETIGSFAFFRCPSLRKIKMSSVRTIGRGAFLDCTGLGDLEFSDKLETIGEGAFIRCRSLGRIAIPLKDNMFPLHPALQRCNQFGACSVLKTVDLVGIEGIHKTVASLRSWRVSWGDEILQEISRIDQVLPKTYPDEKTEAIRLWMRSVIVRIEHYKAEHYALLKEDMTQLELAVWKAKLDEREERGIDGKSLAKKAKIDVDTIRKEKRITSGASIIIKNVLPFLQLAK